MIKASVLQRYHQPKKVNTPLKTAEHKSHAAE